MAELIVYEKSTCTTCKKLYALLTAHGIDYATVDFHVEPLSPDELRALVAKTAAPARELFRAREPVFAELGLADRPDIGDEEAIALMAEHPPLMQRPVVERGGRAVLARPVERALELLDPAP